MDKKVFIYSDYYKPGYLAGGPIQSISNMCNLLNGFFFIYTQNFDLNNEKSPYPVEINSWIENGSSKVFYTTKSDYRFSSWRQLFHIKPDVVYLNSLFSTATQLNLFQVLFYSLFHKCRIIIAPRGELDEGALELKKRKKATYIFLFKLLVTSKIIFHATTEKEKNYIAKKIKNRIIVAENIPEVLDKNIVREKVKDHSKFIFISRICHKKNLFFALECLNKINISGNLDFTIIGPFEDMKYWESCKDLIDKLPTNINCKVLGPVPHSEINKSLAESHYLLLPTMAENFGHIIYESLINGLPVIISDNTPWDDGFSNGVFAYSLSNEELFIKRIENLHALEQAEYQVLSNNAFAYAKNKVNFEFIKEQYFNLFN